MHKPNVDSAVTPARLRRGRKPKNKAVVDFGTADAIEEYKALLAKFQNANHSDMAPHEVAAEAMRETWSVPPSSACSRISRPG